MREWKVVSSTASGMSLIPVITILGSQFSALIGGSVVVETVFAWPGIGTLIVTSAQQRDFPVVVFGVLVICGVGDICESFGRPFLWFAGSANTRSLKDFG